MNNTNTGGPAFPSPTDGMLDNEGMTLRDYFAAKAMQGWLASFPNDADPLFVRLESVATFAYNISDAMLKARGA